MTALDLARVICALSELGEDGCRGFTIGEGDWPLRGLVLRSPEGIRAFVNHCPHAGHRLNQEPHRFLTSDGALILCSSHGALFERDGGLCIAGPCSGRRLIPVPIKVEAGYVLLADDADPAALQALTERR